MKSVIDRVKNTFEIKVDLSYWKIKFLFKKSKQSTKKKLPKWTQNTKTKKTNKPIGTFYNASSSSYPVYPVHRKTMGRVWGGKDGGNSYP